MAVEEINAKGGVLGRRIHPVVVDPASNSDLFPPERVCAENKRFVANFKCYSKRNNLPDGDRRSTNDPIEAAYYGLYGWKQAVEKTGKVDVDQVRRAVYGMEFNAPGGRKKMEEANRHTHKPGCLARSGCRDSLRSCGGQRDS